MIVSNRPRDLIRSISILLFLALISIAFLLPSASGVEMEENSPWVYPASETNPTGYEYYKVPLHGGDNEINLVLWNHHPQRTFYGGRFVIAIKNGVVAEELLFIIKDMNLVFDTMDLSGTTDPGDDLDIDVPPGGIFPCPWIRYEVDDLTKRQHSDKWWGAGDPSGVLITLTIEVPYPISSEDIELYFMAIGWENREYGGRLWSVASPYSHATGTVPIEPHIIPELPMGTIMAIIAPIAALTFYKKKKKIQ